MGILSSLRNYFLPGSLHTEEFAVISLWLIRLRWAAVFGFFLLALFFSHFAPALLPPGMLYFVCIVIFLYNLIFFVSLKIQKGLTKQIPFFLTRLQVLLDWIALLVIIHLTGGIFSPLIFFFILHIIINSMIFPPYQCYIYTALSLSGLGVLFFIEKIFTDFSVTVSWLGTSFQEVNFFTILFAFIIYAFILFNATFLATSIMARFRQREKDVRLLSQQLQSALTRMEALYEATKTMVASDNVNTILNIIVRESTRIMKVKGSILRLVKKGEEELTPSASFGLSETFLNKGPVKRGEGLFPMNFDEVIMVEDVKTDPRIVYPKEAAEEGIRSIISIPLAHKGEVKGDLRFYSEFPRRFSNDEISFLKIMAGGAAVILDNASTWKELVDTNKRIILFANKMSHDLRAPVFAVQSLLSAMKEGYAGEVSPKQKEILTRCVKKQEQLLFLIRDILNLAEEQVSIQGQKLVPINLNEVATETLKLLELLFQKKKIAIIYNPPSDPIPFQESPGDFQRLLFNLLENALRYTPEGGKVELEVKNNAENISILVKDTGIGIASEDIDKIFEEFHRTSQAKKFIQDGTGLGLPIVRSIVRRYNGHINVESQLETGTKIFITLPHT